MTDQQPEVPAEEQPDVPSDPNSGGGAGSAHNATISVEENE
jgi:hypothetical protein